MIRQFLFFIMLTGTVAMAQQKQKSGADTIPARQVPVVTVTAQLNANFSMPMVVMDSTVLRSFSFVTPADALQRRAGIALTRDGAWATSVNIRGLSGERLILSSDGDRIQTSSDIAAALSTVDMNSLSKIEVVKGAASVLYGSGAMGGIVNFVSARPQYSTNFAVTGNASSALSSVNGLWANNASVNFTTNQWYIALTGSYRTAGNTHSPDYTLFGSQFNDASWGLKAGIKYDSNQEFLVNYEQTKTWNTGITGVSALANSASARYKKADRGQLSGEYVFTDLNDYLNRISLKVYTQNVTREVEILPLPDKVSYPKKRLYPSSSNDTYGAKLSSDWQLERRHQLSAGVEGWYRNSVTSRLVYDQKSDTLTFVTREQPVANANQLDLGTWAYYTFKIVPSEWILNAGIRADYIRTANDSAYNPVYVQKFVGNTQEEYNFTRSVLFTNGHTVQGAYAAHIDLKYYMSASQSLALSVANSYRVASIDERFKYIDLGAVAPVKVGNPNLKPEKGAFADLNYTLATGAVTLKADVYSHYMFDLIAEQSGTFMNRPALINTNINKALFVGSEFELDWTINRNLSFNTNASYVYTRDVDAGTALPQVPPMNGFAELSYRIGKVMNAALSTKWATDQNRVATNEAATPGYAVLNVNFSSIRMPVFNNMASLQVFAGVDNIMNSVYYNHLTTVRLGGSKLQEPGRNFWLRSTVRF